MTNVSPSRVHTILTGVVVSAWTIGFAARLINPNIVIPAALDAATTLIIGFWFAQGGMKK